MARARTLTLRNKVEVTGADKLRNLGDRLRGVGTAMSIGITAPLTVLGATAVNAASELEQQMGAVDSVFGKSREAIDEFAKTSADAFGLSRREAMQFGSLLGAQLQSFGFDATAAGDEAVKLQQRAADMAATFGGPVSDAVGAISSLMRGETNPIERYAVNIKQADVNARLAADGLDKLTGEARRQAEAQTRLNLLYEQTALTQGQFGRESDTLAGQQARLAAKWEDVQATLGQKLLPVMVGLAEAAGGVLDAFSELDEDTQGLIVTIGGLAAVMGPLLIVVGSILRPISALWKFFMAKSAVTGITGAASALGKLRTALLLLTGPVGIAVAAVGALATAFATDFLGVRSRFEKDMKDIGDAVRGFFGIVEEETRKGGFSNLTESQQQAIMDQAAGWEEMQSLTSKGVEGIQNLTKNAKRQTQLAAQEGLADPLISSMLGAKEEMEDIAGETPGSIAQALLDAQFRVEDAAEQLQQTAEQALHPMIERAQIIAFLSSQELADGLASGIPAVRARALELKQAAESRLLELNGFSYGLNFGTSFADGMNAAYGYVINSAGQLAAAARGQIGIQSEPSDPRSPLRGITKWGGNLVDTYAEGIRKRIQILRQTMQTMAAAAVPSVTPLTPALAGVPAGRASGVNITNITVNVEGRPLDGSVDELVRAIRSAERVNEWGQI